MKQVDVENRLINRTISVIATEGLDKTTTKAIVSGTGINEAYIYRFFSGKEDLLTKTFDELDQELFNQAMEHIEVMYNDTLDYRTRCRRYFVAVWKFLLGNKEKCMAFIRYFYSPYFTKFSLEKHKKRYAPLVKCFEDAFRLEANVWMLLNHMLNVMLGFAVKVFNLEVPDDEDTEEHVFRLVYASVQQYFKNQNTTKTEECLS